MIAGLKAQFSPLPIQMDRRNADEEAHQQRGDHAANHRRGNAAHDLGIDPFEDEDGQQVGDQSDYGHGLGPQPLHGAGHDDRYEVGPGVEPTLLLVLVLRQYLVRC